MVSHTEPTTQREILVRERKRILEALEEMGDLAFLTEEGKQLIAEYDANKSQIIELDARHGVRK